MKKLAPVIIVAVVAVATLVSATVLYRAKRSTAAPLQIKDAGSNTSDQLHVLGPANATVTLEEYGDFQCPPCGSLSAPLNQIVDDYRPHVRLIFHEFPLASHAHAREAAQAAEAAALQGKFWPMHDLIYREQAIWTKATDVHSLFNSYAGILGLDIERFKADMQGVKVKERVDGDQKHGTSIGVKNTPTIFLNNTAVEPDKLNPQALRTALDALVKTSQPSASPASTTK